MSDYKEKHIEKKKAILKCLNEAEKFFTENNYVHGADVIADSINKLESGEFTIAVVGEFSSGKSTLLNALMGEKILPSFTDETTATVNFLRHKEHATEGECGEVFYNDGTSQKINSADLETVSKYVCTNSDVDVVKEVDHLDLFLDSKFLEGNVTLVDTPGLNGVAEGHREITMEQIEKSSAGIFMFNANQPGSRSDFEFLTELRKNIDGSSILLLLNQIDTLKKEEGQTVEMVIQKLKDNYRKVYPDVKTIPEIWPVAAYPALVARSKQEKFDYHGKYGNFTKKEKEEFEELSQMKSFEERLWKFLTQGEKAKQELLAPVSQLIAQLTSLKKDINYQLEILNGSVDKDSIEEQKLELDRSLESLNEKLSLLTKGMKKEVVEAEADFLHEIRAEIDRFSDKYGKSIMDFEDIEEIDNKYVEKYIQKKLTNIVSDAYENYGKRIRNIMSDNVADITDDLNSSLSDDLNVKISGGLEIKSVKTGLEDYEKTCLEIAKQIEELDQEINDSEDDLIKAMSTKRKKESLEKQLRCKNEAKQAFEENVQMYMPRGAVKQGKPEMVKVGLFKKVLYYPEVIDYSERDRYIEENSKITKRYEDDIAKIENELLRIPDSDVEIQEKALRRKEAKKIELRAEKTAFQEKYAAEIKVKCKAALDVAKKTILQYIDDAKEEYIRNIKKEFSKRRMIQLSIMEQLIGQSVIYKIEMKKKEIELLDNKLKEAVNERDASVTKLNEQKTMVTGLLKKALDLESEINSIKVDIIKEQEI